MHRILAAVLVVATVEFYDDSPAELRDSSKRETVPLGKFISENTYKVIQIIPIVYDGVC